MFFIVLLIVLYSASVSAQVRSLDLSIMSVEELDVLEDEVKEIKKHTIDFPNEVFELLKSDFMETVESLTPDAVE